MSVAPTVLSPPSIPEIKRGPGRPPKTFAEVEEKPRVLSTSEIRRFDLADLEPLGTWLYERLKERYPHLNTIMFPTWVRQWIASNEYLFIRNDSAVALAEVCRNSMDMLPWVREIFVYAKEDADEDGVALYHAIRDWAINLDAVRIIVGEDTDISLEMIELGVGKLMSRKLSYLKLR